MKKQLPNLTSDEAAEAFVAGSDLTDYDFSVMQTVRFELQPKSVLVKILSPKFREIQ